MDFFDLPDSFPITSFEQKDLRKLLRGQRADFESDWTFDDGAYFFRAYAFENNWIFDCNGLGCFKVSKDGRSLQFTLDSCRRLEDSERAEYLSSLIPAFILSLQGAVCVHAASTLSEEGEAKLFVGDTGAGKSSQSAREMLSGRKVLQDDISSLILHEGRICVFGGCKKLKLWPESPYTSLLHERGLLQSTLPDGKQVFGIPAKLQTSRSDFYPVESISFSSNFAFQKASAAKSLRKLLENLYIGPVLDTLSLSEHSFQMLSQLVNQCCEKEHVLAA